jgi:hypothetical protein
MRASTLFEWGIIILVVGVPAFIVWQLVLPAGPASLSGTTAPAGPSYTSVNCSGLGYGGFYQEDLPFPGPTPITGDNGVWSYTLNPLYNYTIVGKIVGKDEYSLAGGNDISPMDLTIANGDVISPRHAGYFTFRKVTRGFMYLYNPPAGAEKLSLRYITEHTSNNHLIFADESVHRMAQTTSTGDFVRISGYLITASGRKANGQTTYQGTSTTRSDTGADSCEVVYVRSLEKLPC